MAEHKQEQQASKRVIVKSEAQQPEVSVSRLAVSNAAIRRATIDPGRMTTRDVMAMQHTMGNHAVAQLLGRRGNSNTPPTQTGPDIQTSPTAGLSNDYVGQSGDAPLSNALVQRTSEGGFEAEGDFESRLNRSKGGGAPLPDHLRADFEPKFGADFGQVRIHTNNQSDRLNRSIQAKAFTHGNDIFFRKGEFNAKSSGGKQLLAHELTHTVQQGAAPIQRQESASIPDELKQRHGPSSGEGSATSAKMNEHQPGSQGGQAFVAHEVIPGGQQLGGVVQRVDEIIPLEDYGDLAIPNKWNLLKKFGSQPRNAKPTNRMKPAEDKATVAERLRGKVHIDPSALAQQSDDIGVLYAHAQMLQAFYDHTLGHVAERTTGTYKPGPIKELGRTMDKVTTDYTKKGVQRPELVKDLLRSSIVFDNAHDLVEAVAVIRGLDHREPSIKIMNLKNKFTGNGYGDINMSLEVGDGYIAELQLHLSKFWDIKMSKGDHHLYEQISQLERQTGKLKPKDEIKLKQLKQRQNQTYMDALNTEDNPENAIRELSSIRL